MKRAIGLLLAFLGIALFSIGDDPQEKRKPAGRESHGEDCHAERGIDHAEAPAA